MASVTFTPRALEGCALRPFRRGDEEALVRHANSKAVWLHLQDSFPHPFTFVAAAGWIKRCLAREGQDVHVAITVKDEVVGGIGLRRQADVQRYTAEMGYWLGEAAWGRGYATEAVRAMTNFGFEELGLLRIEARVFENNPASRRVLEKAGYELEGRLRKSAVKEGEVLDQFLYAKVR